MQAHKIVTSDMVKLFVIRVCCVLDNVRGDYAESVSFTTLASEPEPPAPPKLVSKTKATLQLKWNVGFSLNHLRT